VKGGRGGGGEGEGGKGCGGVVQIARRARRASSPHPTRHMLWLAVVGKARDHPPRCIELESCRRSGIGPVTFSAAFEYRFGMELTSRLGAWRSVFAHWKRWFAGLWQAASRAAIKLPPGSAHLLLNIVSIAPSTNIAHCSSRNHWIQEGRTGGEGCTLLFGLLERVTRWVTCERAISNSDRLENTHWSTPRQRVREASL